MALFGGGVASMLYGRGWRAGRLTVALFEGDMWARAPVDGGGGRRGGKGVQRASAVRK